jgi:AAA+ ATPase superfamily predicted ATPase
LKGVTVRDGEYVKRPEKEKEVLVALKSPNYETVFVYGPRGSGKTSLIRHTFKGRKGGV